MSAKLTAGDLLDALRARHAKDVFVSECKTGPTQGGLRKLDAWAMPKSWAPWTVIGYEVKVSRADFVADAKWPAYLPVCHELYFVAPPRLIALEELPREVGLLCAHGSRLVTKRKAVRREPDHKALSLLMSYVLMSRARIVSDWRCASGNVLEGADYWRAWLADKRERQSIGHAASRRVAELCEESDRARRRAERERDELQAVRDELRAAGFDGGATKWTVRNAATREPLLRAIRQIAGMADSIKRVTERELAEAQHEQQEGAAQA